MSPSVLSDVLRFGRELVAQFQAVVVSNKIPSSVTDAPPMASNFGLLVGLVNPSEVGILSFVPLFPPAQDSSLNRRLRDCRKQSARVAERLVENTRETPTDSPAGVEGVFIVDSKRSPEFRRMFGSHPVVSSMHFINDLVYVWRMSTDCEHLRRYNQMSRNSCFAGCAGA